MDSSDHDRMVCDILDYRPFPAPVPFKVGAVGYLEADGARRGYFQRGVRAISNEEFEGILTAAASAHQEAVAAQKEVQPRSGASYGSPERISEVDRFAVTTAVSELRRRYPGIQTEVQPQTNPGFDILVKRPGDPLYVEVKGTGRNVPVFFLTEGERRFSQRHASAYCLIVVYAIEAPKGAYQLFWHEGPISDVEFLISPVQWACEVRQVQTSPEAPADVTSGL